LFPGDPTQRALCRELYASVAQLPIISPHGHTDPTWFAYDEPFPSPTALLLAPDHYLYRMMFSQGIDIEDLGVAPLAGAPRTSPRDAWRLFASHYHVFRGTPSRIWLDTVFATVFGIDVRLDATTADHYYDTIEHALTLPSFRPRALFERFGIEVLATTESPTDTLQHHQAIVASGWGGRVVTAYRPDPVVDADREDFQAALTQFAEITNEDTHDWEGYLAAHRKRRQDFIGLGATSSDHGHPTALTADLAPKEAASLFQRIVRGKGSAQDHELFRAHMITEMAAMSCDDGLVLQIHPGSMRNHNQPLFTRFGRDKGADIPTRTDFVRNLKPLLDRFGSDKRLSIIVFTLDESAYARELAPLAGHYPALKLGPAWWFHDSPEGMRRFREQTTETAGFYNTVGFNDDTRAFLSIPARHDVARRVDCGFLARLVAEHRLELDEAHEVAIDLAYRLPKQAYRF
jgi:glucuronate isomerase